MSEPGKPGADGAPESAAQTSAPCVPSAAQGAAPLPCSPSSPSAPSSPGAPDPADSGAAPDNATNATNADNNLAERLDRALRALAEAENARKRAERDRDANAKYAVGKFAGDVLAVADNLSRALATIPDDGKLGADGVQSLIEGVELTGRELDNALKRHGIEKIDPMGEPFDHNAHEVLFEVEVPDRAPGTIVQVMQPGYRIHDRLLRPARVGVAKKPAAASGVDSTA